MLCWDLIYPSKIKKVFICEVFLDEQNVWAHQLFDEGTRAMLTLELAYKNIPKSQVVIYDLSNIKSIVWRLKILETSQLMCYKDAILAPPLTFVKK